MTRVVCCHQIGGTEVLQIEDIEVGAPGPDEIRIRVEAIGLKLHWRGQHPLEETIAAFEQLQHEGKILCWGVSNFDVPDLEAVQKIAGEGSLVCNQVLYHLRERAIEHAVIPWRDSQMSGAISQYVSRPAL
jgi:aryl-alcohol dehydrogenase-like predicted oxidoreductase